MLWNLQAATWIWLLGSFYEGLGAWGLYLASSSLHAIALDYTWGMAPIFSIRILNLDPFNQQPTSFSPETEWLNTELHLPGQSKFWVIVG